MSDPRPTARRPLIDHPSDPDAMLVTLTRGFVAVISKEDAEEVSRSWWFAAKGGRGGMYATRMTKVDGRKQFESLHRMVAGRMGLPLDREIDHENRDSLDCRRRNLRAATPVQNQANRGPQKNNRCGYKGVYWCSREKKWGSRVQYERKYEYLGLFVDPADAARAYDEAAVRRHGQFAFVNFPLAAIPPRSDR